MQLPKLIELLQELAEHDLAEGANISAHPCYLAIKALEGCYRDIETLRKYADHKGKSKRVQLLIRQKYNPSF